MFSISVVNKSLIYIYTTIIIIMGLRSVSASEDVIGDLSRPGTNNSALLEPRREEQEKLLGERASFRFNRAGKKDLRWEKMCF